MTLQSMLGKKHHKNTDMT